MPSYAIVMEKSSTGFENGIFTIDNKRPLKWEPARRVGLRTAELPKKKRVFFKGLNMRVPFLSKRGDRYADDSQINH
jgi:hypothetical protein